MRITYGFMIAVVLCAGFFGVSHAENLNFMRTGDEVWSVESLQTEIQTLEGSIELSQMRLEEMKKELALRVSKIDTAAGQEATPEKDHFLGH